MMSEDKKSAAHEGCEFLSCKIGFKTDDGATLKSSTVKDKKGENLIADVMNALVYVNGYERALEMAKKAADKHKYSWP